MPLSRWLPHIIKEKKNMESANCFQGFYWYSTSLNFQINVEGVCPFSNDGNLVLSSTLSSLVLLFCSVTDFMNQAKNHKLHCSNWKFSLSVFNEKLHIHFFNRLQKWLIPSRGVFVPLLLSFCLRCQWYIHY